MLTKTDKNILDFLEKYHSLTLNQISNIFFVGKYKYASRRMIMLENQEFQQRTKINSAINKNSKERVYYYDYILSEHNTMVFQIYSKIHELGGYVSKFEWQPQYLNDLIRADAYIEFEYLGNLYLYIVEVDYSHFTPVNKFKLYEKLYKDNILQPQCYGIFPNLMVIRKTNNDIRYNSKYFNIYYLDENLSKFKELVLGIVDK